MALLKNGGVKPLAMTSQNLPNGKPSLSSIQVKRLTKSEISLLRQSMIDAFNKLEQLNRA